MVDENENGERLVIRLDIDLRKHTCSLHRRRSASVLNTGRRYTPPFSHKPANRNRRSNSRSTSLSRSTSFFSDTDSVSPVAEKKMADVPRHVELFRELQQFVRYLQVKYKIDDFSVAPAPPIQTLSQPSSASSNAENESRPTPALVSLDAQSQSKPPPSSVSTAASAATNKSSKSSRRVRKKKLRSVKSPAQMETETAEALDVKQLPEHVDPITPAGACVMGALTGMSLSHPTSDDGKSPKKHDFRSPTNSNHSLPYEPQSQTSILKEPFRQKKVCNPSETKFDSKSTSFFVSAPKQNPGQDSAPSAERALATGGSNASSSNASIGSYITAIEDLDVDPTQKSETPASASSSKASLAPSTVSPLVRATPMASDSRSRN